MSRANRTGPGGIPAPPVAQPHELQYKILRERQALERAQQHRAPSEGRQGSVRGTSSQRSGSNRGDAYPTNPNAAETGSSRSAAASSRGYGALTGASNRTGASISSSVALGKLNKLEEMLLEERRARQGAESMLLALQRERVAREDAVRQSEVTKKQLDDLMGALRVVVSKPDEVANVRKLQQLIDKTQVDPTVYPRLKAEAAAADQSSGKARFAKNGTSLAPPYDAKYVKRVAHGTVLPDLKGGPAPTGTASQRSDGAPRTFLDGMGQFERSRERERLNEKAQRRQQSGGAY